MTTDQARSAALLGGRHADLVSWTDDERPALLGHYGAGALPTWMTLFYSQVAAPDRIAYLWERPPLPEAFASRVDDDPGEDGGVLGRTFPHRLPRGPARARYQAWQTLPDSDRALVELASYTARRLDLGRDDVTDFLLVSFSSVDAIGHEFGPDSLERAASLAALDRHVGELVTSLVEQSSGRLLVALTADHGMAPTITQARRDGHASDGVDTRVLATTVEDALTRELGPGPHVAALLYPYLFLRPMAADVHARAVALAVETLRRQHAVYGAWPTAQLEQATDPVAKLFWNGAYPSRSGDVALALEPYFSPVQTGGNTLGANHGSPWPYDRHVPILLWGDGVEHAVIETPVTVEALVRTLALHLDVPPGPNDAAPLP